MDPTWLVVVPAGALGRSYLKARKELRQSLSAPLFFEGDRAWTLAGLVAEFNGEADLESALAELLGAKAPLKSAQVVLAVQRLQADANLRRAFLRDLAADAALAGQGPTAAHAPLDLMVVLDQGYEADGFRGLWAAVNERRKHALLPVVAMQAGGGLGATLPGEARVGPGVTGAMLEAGRKALLGEAPGGWAAVGAELLGALAEARLHAQVREHRRRQLARLGRAAMEALAQGQPSGLVLKRNAHQTGDAYRQLLLTWEARLVGQGRWAWPNLQATLHLQVAQALRSAQALAAEQGRAIESVLRGNQGPEAAGALLLAHREVLTKGLAPDALPFPRAGEEEL